MDRGQFALELFGKPIPVSLPLDTPLRAYAGTLFEVPEWLGDDKTGHGAPGRASCDGIEVQSLDDVLAALCSAMVAAGRHDAPMQMRWPDGEAAVFIDSIHSVAQEAQNG